MTSMIINQTQGSYASSRSSCIRRVDSTHSLSAFCMVQRREISLIKQMSSLCGTRESPLIHGSNLKHLKASCFKGNMQSDEYRNGFGGSKSRKNPVEHLHVLCDNRKDSMRSLKVQNSHANLTSDTNATTEACLAIRRLFKSWLMVDKTLDGPSLNKRVETDHKLSKYGIPNMIWSNILGVGAAIKIPAVIFILLFFIVNMKYGAQVAKELSPLWIGGPLIIALYIKMVQALCTLYAFSFKQSVKVLTVCHGKDREFILVHFWRRVVYFMNLDYKYESKRIWKDFRVWLVDACLDFVESVWSYRKLVGVLKMTKIM